MKFQNNTTQPGNGPPFLQRMFGICPFDESRKVGLWRRLADHTVAGAILGILILHPLSMIAHNFFHLDSIRFWNIIALSFSSEHMVMTLYFILVGAVIGLVHGSYIHTISGLYEKIRMLAISDELTGLYNRRFFMNRLDQEIARAERYDHSLSLLMIDIDNFKQFNDMHGHPAGDELLERLGQILRDLIREADFAARYGGEEFVIVMPETQVEMAYSLAERICASVSEYPFRHRKVTISAGLAGRPDDAQSLEELIQKADQALYDAKHSGKNRVCRFRHVRGEQVRPRKDKPLIHTKP